MLVRSFGDIHKLNLTLKRDAVRVTKAGGHYRARFHGHANCVFSSTAEGALQRLLDSPEHIFRNNNRNSNVTKKNRKVKGEVMPNIKTVSDGGSDPNTPTVEQMRESQRKGSTGNGFAESYADKMTARNHGTGKGEGKDEQFSNAGEHAAEGTLPWE